MATMRTNKIKMWMEKHKSITISQCNRLFYDGSESGYLKSRQKLQAMYKQGDFKRYQESNIHEVQYYMKDVMKVHDLKLLDLAAEFVFNGYKIIKFKEEYTIKTENGTFITDGMMNLEKDNKLYLMLIEIDFESPTKQPKLDFITQQLSLNNEVCTILLVKQHCKNRRYKLLNGIYVHTLPWDLNYNLKL